MLEWLKIKNFALVEELDIDFFRGFNVITGETGAGKSIILGAISLLLGERADKTYIRQGTDRCEISCGILLNEAIHKKLAQLLSDSGIDAPKPTDPLFLRRVISASNTRNFVNDTPVTLTTLKTIGDYLIDIHGAHEHQSLIKHLTQLELLDRYANLESSIQECRNHFEQVRSVQAKREDLQQNLPSAIEVEHLRILLEEISKIAPEPGEDETISQKHKLAANAQNVLQVTSQSVYTLSESEDSVTNQLGEVYRHLTNLARIDEEGASQLLEQCSQITDLIRDLVNDVESYASRIEIDEQEFIELENRLAELQRLKRRYGPTLEQVFATEREAVDKVAQFDNAESLLRQLDTEEAECQEKLETAAQKLSGQRNRSAQEFCRKVRKELKTLGFLQAEFDISFTEIPPGPNGMDKIEFVFSANPGVAMQPLRQIASSGEMSRVMLALKTVLATADAVPILIFDEIDVNIGGETAIKVGNALEKLGKSHQLFCISHLPQVAARAENHFLVEKSVKNKQTLTSIYKLTKERRSKEITRMLGGGKAAEKHAKELLN